MLPHYYAFHIHHLPKHVKIPHDKIVKVLWTYPEQAVAQTVWVVVCGN